MFAAGHHLYRGPDSTWRYSAPGDVFVRVNGDDRLLALVRDIATGAAPAPAAGPDQDRVRGIVAALTERGVLIDPPAAADGGATVHVEGAGPVAAQLVALLRESGPVRCTTGPVDERLVAASDAVVSCAGWLPDARWCQLDDWCTAHGTPWHCCYAEGDTFVLGPLSIPDRTASYRDTRGRRLAAAALPDELLAHWAYLDSDAPKPPVAPPPGTASVLAGLLAADVLALLAGRTVPSHGHQLVVEPATATVRRHPVLALPRLAVNPA